MTKLFRKIRQKLLSENKFKRYLVYAIGEILLIVVGILIALQVNTINGNRIKRSSELTIYKTIKGQIENYKLIIEDDIEFNKDYMNQFEYANEIIESNDQTRRDTLGRIANGLINYSDFDGRGNIYETIVSSGEIKLLKNPKIVEGIRMLEERFLRINRIENIHYDAIMIHIVPTIKTNVKFSTGRILNPDSVYQPEFQNSFLIILRIMYEKDQIYKAAVEEINDLALLIESEINGK